MNDLRHSFPGQEQSEAIFVFARPYFLAFLPTFLIFALVYLLALIAQIALISTSTGLSSLFIGILVLGLGIFQLFSLAIFLVAILDFYYSIVIVTDRRLVNIDQEQLFSRRISELDLEEIEDVTSTVKGFLPTMFNYGTVLIQTAGTEDNFSMDNIRFPREVAALTLSLSEQAKKHQDENTRYPETEVMAVINNHPLHTLDELESLGAAVPDVRRVMRNETPPV